MQKIKVFLISCFIIFAVAVSGISAQSADVVDNLLASENANFGDSVYMAVVGSGLADDTISIDEAVKLINSKGLNAGNKSAEKNISLGEFSYIVMKLFQMDGGIMYMLFPSPRYAARELDYLGLIDGDAHPGNPVSGSEIIRIISGVIDIKEAR